MDDFARFEEWLATSEKTAALPNSSGVLYTVAKEELKKFEVLVHISKYTALEIIQRPLCNCLQLLKKLSITFQTNKPKLSLDVFLQAFQRQVHESLTQLELINKQYRRLARENRTDSSCRLREMAQDANQRWDNLQKRVASILRRLKVHYLTFISPVDQMFCELRGREGVP